MGNIKKEEKILARTWMGANIIGLISAFAGGLFAPEGTTIRSVLIFGGLALMVIGMFISWIHAFFEE